MGRGKIAPSVPAPLKPVTFTFDIPAMPVARNSRNASGKLRPDPSKPPRLILSGYYTQGARPNWSRLKAYHDWKDHVRLHTPTELHEHNARDYDSRIQIDTVAYFASGVHNDPENVRKSIVDAICAGGDKWAFGAHDFPRYDTQHPRVEVTVTVWR